MIPILKAIYCKIDEKDTNALEKVDAILATLLLKMYEQSDIISETKDKKTATRKKKIEALRKRFNKANLSAKSKAKTDSIETIGEVLFGKESSI